VQKLPLRNTPSTWCRHLAFAFSRGTKSFSRPLAKEARALVTARYARSRPWRETHALLPGIPVQRRREDFRIHPSCIVTTMPRPFCLLEKPTDNVTRLKSGKATVE